MKSLVFSTLLAGSLALGSCASIVSRSHYPVAISSAPAGATVTVLDRGGKEIFSGTTPAALELKSSAGFFQRAKYTVTFKKPGFDTKTMALEANVNGWYFGNLLFGGWIGMLIVDPATGAMYRISQRDMQAALTQSTSYSPGQPDPHGLRIASLTDVPDQLRPLMVRVPQ